MVSTTLILPVTTCRRHTGDPDGVGTADHGIMNSRCPQELGRQDLIAVELARRSATSVLHIPPLQEPKASSLVRKKMSPPSPNNL